MLRRLHSVKAESGRFDPCRGSASGRFLFLAALLPRPWRDRRSRHAERRRCRSRRRRVRFRSRRKSRRKSPKHFLTPVGRGTTGVLRLTPPSDLATARRSASRSIPTAEHTLRNPKTPSSSSANIQSITSAARSCARRECCTRHFF